MKSLLLIRHAKSSWNFDVDDFDRPLNSRGQSDAPDMAKRLLAKQININAIVASPAKRTQATGGFFAEVHNLSADKITTVAALYEPVQQAFINAVAHLTDADNIVALFSHNPGITAFANSLTETQIDDMPTCAIFAVQAQVDHWKDFAEAKKEFWFFDYPKS